MPVGKKVKTNILATPQKKGVFRGRGLYWKPIPWTQTRKRAARKREAQKEDVLFFIRRFTTKPPGMKTKVQSNRLWEDYSTGKRPKDSMRWDIPGPKVDILAPRPDFFDLLPKEQSDISVLPIPSNLSASAK